MGQKLLWIVALLGALGAKTIVLDFSSTPVTSIPTGWMMSAYNKKSVGIWEVTKEKRLLLTKPRGYTKQQFNIFYTNAIWIEGGSVAARLRIVDGTVQGAGVLWHMRDRKHFQAVLLDPTKKHIQLINVSGKKIAVPLTKTITLAPSPWHSIEVRFSADTATILVDDAPVAAITTPPPQKGGVGIITQGDTKVLCESIRVRPDTR